MSKTRAELINQCLTNLGVIAEGQTVSDQDVSKMDTIVDAALAEISGLELYYISDAGQLGPSGGSIDDAAFLPVCDYITARAAPAFNLPADAKLEALALLAEKKLITLSAPARTFRTLRIDPALQGRRYGLYRGGFT